ncbi:MAG: M20/M25/M40 family metallo-hydrolase [Rectinema subterraneum]
MKKKIEIDDTQALAIRLVRAPSVTNTSGESSFPDVLISILREQPFFSLHPELIHDVPIEGDSKGRRNVLAFAPGKGSSCVVLAGHYDVVDTNAYGVLEPFAFDPEALSKRMLQMLSSKTNLSSSELLLKKDLESTAFIPGRGMLDMKSGLAAGIAAMVRFLKKDDRTGNILFIAVPDEEGSSTGMKAAKKMLSDFADEHALHYEAIINLDASVDSGDGDEGKAVFLGSVSKLLPFVVFVGKPAHAGSPFDGFNPVIASAVFAREIECNSDSMNIRALVPGEEPPPPSILYYREMRNRYDVTMPADVFCAVNILTFEKDPEKVFDHFKTIVQKALDNSISLIYERASAFSRKKNEHVTMYKFSSEIIEFHELAKRAERVVPGILDRLQRFAEKSFPEDKVQQTFKIVHELLSYAQIEGPSAIVGFAPPFYAKAQLDSERDQGFLSIIKDEVMSFNRDYGESIKLRPYFPGISDMSYLAPSVSREAIEFVKKESAVLQSDLDKYLESPLDTPVINVGPWGREYHQNGERVHRHYAFSLLPELLFRLCNRLFHANN